MTPLKWRNVTCFGCGIERSTDTHHITYNPEVIVPLCIDCHMTETLINTYFSLRFGKLENWDRWALFNLLGNINDDLMDSEEIVFCANSDGYLYLDRIIARVDSEVRDDLIRLGLL